MRRQFLVILILAAFFPAVYQIYLDRSREQLCHCKVRLTEWAKRLNFHQLFDRELPQQLRDAASDNPKADHGEGPDYQFTADGARWTLSCKGAHHIQLGIPANCPQYSSEEGLIHYQSVP